MSGRFIYFTTIFAFVLALVLFAMLFWPLGRAKPEGYCSVDEWCWQNPLPQGNALNAVHFVDNDHGWAVGRSGTIIATTDGGQTWSQQDAGTRNDLRTVSFKNLSEGWIGGLGYDSEKRLLHTKDGGVTWRSAGEFDERFEAVTFVDGVGFLAGISTSLTGKIMKMADGAEDWELSYSGEQGTALRALDFLDSSTGWVVGWYGIILHTEDGGASWVRQQNLENPENLDLGEVLLTDVDAVDASEIWGGGRYPNTVFHSTNGGDTWTVEPTGSLTIVDYPLNYPRHTFGLRAIHFTDAQHGWAAGDAWLTGAILRTSDGGETWEEQTGWPLEAFLPNVGESYGHELLFKAMSFTPDAGKAWVVGTGGAVFHSQNGGEAWAEQSYSSSRVLLNAVAFFDDQEGLAAGHNGVVLRTKDGANWELYNPEIEGFCHYSALALSGSYAWLVGYGSPGSTRGRTRIFRSSDRGNEWIEQTSIVDSEGSPLDLEEKRLEAMTFVDDQMGWIGGQYGIILHTNDGGENWVQLESRIESDISSIFFANAQLGWAASGNRIFVTQDGGHYWEPRNLGTTEGITDVAFLDEELGWAVGPGKIFRTEDGGENWQVQFSVPSCAFWGESIAFSDENNVWVSASAGRILHTSDGGTTWSYEDAGTENPLLDIAVNSRDEVWAVGVFSTIVHKDYAAKQLAVSP